MQLEQLLSRKGEERLELYKIKGQKGTGEKETRRKRRDRGTDREHLPTNNCSQSSLVIHEFLPYVGTLSLH